MLIIKIVYYPYPLTKTLLNVYEMLGLKYNLKWDILENVNTLDRKCIFSLVTTWILSKVEICFNVNQSI